MIFGKEKCAKCGNKIEKKHSFCPWCGNCTKDKEEFFMPNFKLGFPFNTIFKQLEKQFGKQFKEMDRMMDMDKTASEPEKAIGLSININVDDSGQPVIRVENMGEEKIGKIIEPKPFKIRKVKISEKDAEKFSKLPKTEPSTNVRRLADKIVYEINLPGIHDKKNIIINKLQNSIEIKAFAKDRAFFKLIPVALPLLKYYLEKEKLILELKPEA